ncbi:unnamed protein product [Dovyalis caffra]|uniref:Uncharacterized protein n=1 Tax=Dovyalis caffra TaxID=77055 RepID=A0AAV1RTE3_9ROSI|nr:unnamed protein product [Dovyalis caffra]
MVDFRGTNSDQDMDYALYPTQIVQNSDDNIGNQSNITKAPKDPEDEFVMEPRITCMLKDA